MTKNTPELNSPPSSWISNAVSKGSMLTASEVANRLGYKTRPSFWAWVHREQPPHIRLSSRNIRFPEKALDAWLAKRSNTGDVE
jgi:predicted DNA-binding transcriptional regulator AlpA